MGGKSAPKTKAKAAVAAVPALPPPPAAQPTEDRDLPPEVEDGARTPELPVPAAGADTDGQQDDGEPKSSIPTVLLGFALAAKVPAGPAMP